MANKKIQMIPPGYTDVVWPETTASQVIQETDKRFMMDAERTKLGSIGIGDGNLLVPATGTSNSGKVLTAGLTAGSLSWVTPVTDWNSLTGKPNNLAGFGITDAAPLSHVGSTGVSQHGLATASVAGFMSPTDKSKLDTMNVGAHPTVTPGIYKSVTVDGNGHITSGTNPTTLVGFGITDAVPLQTMSATLPATAGWYRVATSTVNINRCAGLFKIDWALSSIYGAITLNAGIMFGVDPELNQVQYIHFDLNGLTKARIVYHTTYSGNYAYLEVYNNSAAAIVVTVKGYDLLGWTLISPSTAGSIPGGYTNLEFTFVDGNLITNAQLSNMPVNTIKGAIAAGRPIDLTPAQVRTMLNVQDGAEANVQPDWNQSNTSADDYIKNKPASLPANGGTATYANQQNALADNYLDGAALPSAYPRGETIFFSNSPTNKFNGNTYCTVQTIKGYSNMACIQYIYPYNVDGPIYYRLALYNSDSWLGWRKLFGSGESSQTIKSASAPVDTNAIWLDTTNGLQKYHNGTAWVGCTAVWG